MLDNAAEPLRQARQHQLRGLRGLQAGPIITLGVSPRRGAVRGALVGPLSSVIVRIESHSTVSSEG